MTDPSNAPIAPSRLDDEMLMHWGKIYAIQYKRAEWSLNNLRSTHEEFAREIWNRGLANEFLERLNND